MPVNLKKLPLKKILFILFIVLILLILLFSFLRHTVEEPFTSIIKGYYLMSWKDATIPPPSPGAWDLGIWFSGENPKDAILHHLYSAAKITAGKRILAVGANAAGANAAGAYSTTESIWTGTADVDYVANRAADIKNAGWDGLCFVIDVCTPNVDFIPAFSNCFAACKRAGLLVMIKFSHTLPESCQTGVGQGTELISAWMNDQNIDYLSPSLHESDGTTLNPLNLSAFKNIQHKILLTLPYADDWSKLNKNDIQLMPGGYLAWNVKTARSKNTNFCGLDWASANSSCANPCPIGKDNECPSGQKCYGGLTRCSMKK
jgi:hypothetical protein